MYLQYDTHDEATFYLMKLVTKCGTMKMKDLYAKRHLVNQLWSASSDVPAMEQRALNPGPQEKVFKLGQT